jgi:adenosine deaminase
MAAHPLRAMAEAGLSVSVSTDNRLMSGVTLSGELQAVHLQNGISRARLGGMMRDAARRSFMPSTDRDTALQAVNQWFAQE